MKVNITLLTTITWAARTTLPPGAAGTGPSVGFMRSTVGDGHRVGAEDVALSRGPAHCCPGRPTGLADGLGFESTLVAEATCAPEPETTGRLVPPLPCPAARDLAAQGLWFIRVGPSGKGSPGRGPGGESSHSENPEDSA